jgi:hypothetical protein
MREEKKGMRHMSLTHYKTKNSKALTRISKNAKAAKGQGEV